MISYGKATFAPNTNIRIAQKVHSIITIRKMSPVFRDGCIFTPGSHIPSEQNPCDVGRMVCRASAPLSRKERITGAQKVTWWLTPSLAPTSTHLTATNVSAYCVPTRQHRSSHHSPQAAGEPTRYFTLWKANVTETEKEGKPSWRVKPRPDHAMLCQPRYRFLNQYQGQNKHQ